MMQYKVSIKGHLIGKPECPIGKTNVESCLGCEDCMQIDTLGGDAKKVVCRGKHSVGAGMVL